MSPQKINKQHILSLVCLLILLIPNVACMILSTDLTYSWVKEIGYFIVVLICLFLPMTFLKRKTYFIVEGLLGVFWAPIEIASLFLNGMTVSPHFMAIIFETNRVEVAELLSSMWPLLIVIMCIWGIYWFSVCKMDQTFLLPTILRKITWLSVPILTIVSIMVSVIIQPNKCNGCSTQERLLLAINNVTMKFYKIYPIDISLATLSYCQEQSYIHKLNKQLDFFQFGISTKNDTIEEHYILIIGEAARYDHFYLNGYARATSPNLYTTSNLYSLHHCYSWANLTRKGGLLDIVNPTKSIFSSALVEQDTIRMITSDGQITTILS